MSTIRNLEATEVIDSAILKAAKGSENAIMVASVLITQNPKLIRRVREIAGITQLRAAQLTGCYDSYFSEWENENRKPSLLFADKFVRGVAKHLSQQRTH